MFTLLSQSHKKNLLRQYRLRLLSVLALLASSVFIISALLLLPSYVTLNVERGRLEAENELLTKSIKDQNAKGLVKTLDEIKFMSSLASVEETKLFQAINLAVNDKSPGINITSINYIRGIGAESSIALSGNAAFRSDLIEFSHRLGKEPLFASVNLPIANLAKESDVPFSLALQGAF